MFWPAPSLLPGAGLAHEPLPIHLLITSVYRAGRAGQRAVGRATCRQPA
jgi:hypothetical protein